MADLVVLAVIAAFFALCLAYVALCDRIIGPDLVDVGVPASERDADVDAGVRAA